MRKHCESYIANAERLAANADALAEFHRLRADEMQGKWRPERRRESAYSPRRLSWVRPTCFVQEAIDDP
jgi:hypothetical protein